MIGAARRVVAGSLLGDPSGNHLVGSDFFGKSRIGVPRSLTSLGESSYSLYLFHIFLVVAFAKMWSYAHLTETLPVYVLGLGSFVGALGIGHMIYLYVEKPLTQWLRSLSTLQRPSAAYKSCQKLIAADAYCDVLRNQVRQDQ
jgi:exopolysaccharide production protein ExoZ